MATEAPVAALVTTIESPVVSAATTPIVWRESPTAGVMGHQSLPSTGLESQKYSGKASTVLKRKITRK